MAILGDLNRDLGGGVSFSPPRPRQAPRSTQPVPAPARVGPYDLYNSVRAMPKTKEEEEDKPNVFGRGLGFLVNNPLTQAALKPLQVLDYGRRAVTLGMEELAEGITGQELEATKDDTRSNWDKLKDPEYGVGQLLGGTLGDITPWEWDDQWVDRVGGLIGDIAFDPLSYVGGIGFASKAAAAGGRTARIAHMNRVLNQARRSGADDSTINKLIGELQDVGRKGYGAASGETLEGMGVRGGVRMTTNPFSPYRGLQGTIPGSEKITAPLSRARIATGNAIDATKPGRAVRNTRTVRDLKPEWDRIFRNQGDLDLETALDNVNLYQAAIRQGAEFAQPFVRQTDRLAHETRNMPHELKVQITDALEDRTRKMPEEGKRYREILDLAWKRATEQFKLPLPYRTNYSPHILTRDAIDWRRNPENGGKITAPTGFFTEARYDPSGVTMARKFEVGDEFVVNGNTIKIEHGTINEVNSKFRGAGLNFDFFESDPGIIVQKYINMLSDDVGGWAGARQVAKDTGGRGKIAWMDTTAHGTPVTDAGPAVIRGGGAVVKDGDLAEASAKLGLDTPLDESKYDVVLNKEATKDANLGVRLKAKRESKAIRGKLAETRARITALMAQASTGVVQYGGADSLKKVLKDRQAAVAQLSDDVKQANKLVKELTGEQDSLVDRIAWHNGVVREIEQELLPINILLREISNSAPREFVSALNAERRILLDQLDTARKLGEEARDRIARRGMPDRAALEAVLDERTDALYRSVGLEPPARSTTPTTGPRVAPGTGTAAPGRRAAEIELRIARKIQDGTGYKGDMAELVSLTGRSEPDILADLSRRGVVAPAPKPAGVPTRSATQKAIKQARQEVQDEAKAILDTFNTPLIDRRYMPTNEQIAEFNRKGQALESMNPGDWDALRIAYDRLLSTKDGRRVHQMLKRRGIISASEPSRINAFKPDDWAMQYDSIDEAVDAFFSAAERFANAQARVPSTEVLERAAIKLGLNDVDLVAAARSADAYKEAVGEYTESLALGRQQTLDDIRELIGEEQAARIAGFRSQLDDAGDAQAVLREEIEMAITGQGARPEDYGIEEIYDMDADALASGLQPRAAAEDAIPVRGQEPEIPAGPEFGPQPPERVPSEQLATEYEQLSQLRAQRKTLVDEGNSIPGIERRISEVEARRASLMKEFGFKKGEVPNTMTAQAAVDRYRQKLVNRAQELSLAGSVEDAQELTAQANRFASGDDLLDEYDRLTAAIGSSKDQIKRIKSSGPERRARIGELDDRIDNTVQYIQGRVKRPEGDIAVQQEEILNRLIGREEAGKQAQLRQQPTIGQSNTPNLSPSGTRINNPDAVRSVTRKSFVEPRDGDRYAALKADQNHIRKRLRRIRGRMETIKKKVRDDPRVAQARQRAADSMGDAGAVRKGQAILPERPGSAPQNLKDFPNWDAATDFWTRQVDALTEGVPIKGSPEWGLPNRRRMIAEYERIQKEVGEELGMGRLVDEYEQILAHEAEINSRLGSTMYEADDPAAVRALSKDIQDSIDKGELQSIATERQRIPQTIEEIAAANRNDAAVANISNRHQERIVGEIGAIDEPLKEVLSNPEAREALSREALDQPEAQRVAGVKARKEAEARESASIAAVSEARLPKVTEDLANAQIDLARISEGHMDAARLAGEVRGWLERVKQLSPKNRGSLKVEEFLEQVLKQDPELRNIDNQAIAYNIMKSEELAATIPDQLVALENAKLSAKGDHLSRAVDIVLDPSWSLMYPDMGAVGPIIHADLKKRLQNVRQVSNDGRFWRHIDNLTGLFKTYATLTPGFHVRNAMSAAFMNASDGVPISDSVRAVNVMKEYGARGKEGQRAVIDWLEDQKGVVINKETGATMADALDAVSATGVGGRYREHGVGDRTMAFNRVNERAYSNWMTYYIGKRPGTFVESSVRLPVAIDTLRRGGSVEDAMNRINRLHFDYSQVSDFDQTMRRLIPFWTFMSRNFPLQISQMYTNPRAYAKYNSFVRNFSGEPEENEPEYFSKIGAFRFGDAELMGMPVYLQPDLPFTRLDEEVEKVSDLLSGDNTLRALTDLNPLFTAPAEFFTKQDFYTGQRFDDQDYRETGLIEKPLELLGRFTNQTQVTPGGKRLTNEAFLNAFRAVIPLYDRSVRMAPQVTTGGADQNAVNRQIESAMRTLAGLPIRQLSPQQQQQAAMSRYYDTRDQMSNQQWLASMDG